VYRLVLVLLLLVAVPALRPSLPAGQRSTSPTVTLIPNLSGQWRGPDWGTVTLRHANDGTFKGTYTDTFGKAVGRLTVVWSARLGRFEGTWDEGTYRYGRLGVSVATSGKVAQGEYAASPRCEHLPGVPAAAVLRWEKTK
jgi:hypothetical protein